MAGTEKALSFVVTTILSIYFLFVCHKSYLRASNPTVITISSEEAASNGTLLPSHTFFGFGGVDNYSYLAPDTNETLEDVFLTRVSKLKEFAQNNPVSSSKTIE